MDIALCTEDGITYTAVDFSHLAFSDLGKKRRLLACPECNGPAFFRKASRGGRAPCFGARPHGENCSMATLEHDRQEDGAGEDQDALNNAGTRIVVDFNFGAHDHQDHVETPGLTPNRNRLGRYSGDGTRPDAEMHRRLSSLLKTLIHAPNFRHSDQIIAIEGRPEIPARHFFISLLDADDSCAGRFGGYWGLLSDAKPTGDGGLWLNSGGLDNISFCLSAIDANEIRRRYQIQEDEDFSGAYILIFGTPKISQNGKLYCIVADAAHMVLKLA
jgi:hypothetical protein